MIENEKGFTILEAIISVNVLIIFCGIIVSSMSLLLQNKEQLFLAETGDDLLTDSLHLFLLDRENFYVGDVWRNEKKYTISVNDSNDTLKICISWENRLKESEVCEEVAE